MSLSNTAAAMSADLHATRAEVLRGLLADRLGLSNETRVADLAESARWQHAAAGTILGTADYPLAVVSGLARSVDDDEHHDRTITHGDIIGAGHALGDNDHPEEIVAERDMILASLDAAEVRRLIRRHPEAALHLFKSRPRRSRISATGIGVVALITDSEIDRRVFASRLRSALEGDRRVELLWPERAEVMVDHPGASRHERGEIGDLKIRRLVDQLRDNVDHVIVEAGNGPTPWARRALSMADQIVVVVGPNPDAASLQRLTTLLHHAPLHTRRLLVVEHPAGRNSAPSQTSPLLDQLRVHHAVHHRRGTDMARVARLATGTGRGLVLSGGGARGFAHLGVYRALHELGVEVDIFGGASIGSPLAAGMADGMRPDELDETVAYLFARVLDYTIPLVALVKGNGITRATASVFGERNIEDLWHRYFCVSTNLTTSEIHRHERGSVVHAIRASTAIPGVMPPVPHGDELLVDAGLTNNLPVDLMRELTPQGEIVAVDTTPHRGPAARTNYGLSVSGAQAFRHRVRRKRTHPRITSTLLRALVVGSAQHRQRERVRSNADLYLEVDLRGVPMLAFDAVEELALRGYDSAMPTLEAWLATKEDRHVAPDGL